MPYAKFQQGNKYCVFKLDADGNKVGETLGCHPSEEAAARQVDALYANEKKEFIKEFLETEKAGARHSRNDNDAIQKAHDLLCDLGATCKVPTGYGPLSEKAAEVSLDQRRENIWRAFTANYPQSLSSANDVWIMDVFESYVVVSAANEFYKVAYAEERDGFSFAPRLDWIRVERKQEWIERVKALQHKNTLTIFKDATGHYRWVTLSSSAFKDRDKEIVSTKALADDVARADTDGDFGPLRWWHVPGADLGVCDFNAMEGRVLVESGTFHDEAYGERLKDYANELEISIGFTYPPEEPDRDGVYHHIRRFERSLVPKGKASNLLTQFAVKEGDDMEKEKENKLRQFLGPLADKVLGKAKEVQADAEQKGVAFKSEETPPAAEVKTDAPKTIASMTEDELKAFVVKCMEPSFAEVKALLAKTKEGETATQTEATKAAGELATALKSIQDTLTTQGDAVKMALEGVAELKGELPRSQTKNYFRASEDGPSPGDKLKGLGPQADPLAPFMNALLNQQGQ